MKQATLRRSRTSCVDAAGARSSPQRGDELMRHLQLVEDARDDEIDQVGDGLRVRVEARRRRQDHRAGVRELQHVVEMNRPTAASRAARAPAGGAPSASRRRRARSGCRRGRGRSRPACPCVHGHTAIASAGFEPDATGAIQSSRANTESWPSARGIAFAENSAPPRAVASAIVRSHSCLATTCAAAEYSR